MLPGSGPPVRSMRCQYTLTPDRDFVLGPVPGHRRSSSALGAGHGFKFAPTFGRILADLATTGRRPRPSPPLGLDRPALTDPGYQAELDGVTRQRAIDSCQLRSLIDSPSRAACVRIDTS